LWYNKRLGQCLLEWVRYKANKLAAQSALKKLREIYILPSARLSDTGWVKVSTTGQFLRRSISLKNFIAM
jgi:hypothetical protein